MNRLLSLVIIVGTLITSDVNNTAKVPAGPDWNNLECFTRIKINGHPACRLLVWKI